MYIEDFVIPLNREDLLDSSTAGQFFVKYEYSIEEIRERVEEAKILLNEEGTDFIVVHFSTYFWLLQKFKQCTQLVREKGWKTIRKAFNLLYRNLQVLFDDGTNIDSDVQNKMCNITKMIVYVLIEMMKLQQEQNCAEQGSGLLDGKSKKKQNKVSNEDEEWNEEKHAVLIEIHSFLQLPLKMLWEPPVVDEEFINLIANFCYKCLEDPGISNSNTKYTRETIFQILGILIKHHLHGLSFCVKIVQLLKLNDHLVNPLAQGVVHLVKECSCSNIVKEIVREVADTDGDQLAADTAGTRSLNLFLVQLAESIPEAIIPAIDFLVSHLSGDSYSMRICVVGVLGEIVLNVLTKENLDESIKKMRDEYLNCLEEHIHDVNAFVRTKVLQIWQKLCVGKAIPISRINKLLRLVIGRLNDKSTNVKKQSVHLIKDLLEGNPFCSELNTSEIQRQLEEEKRKLGLLEKEYNVIGEETAWKEMKPKLLELLEEDLDEPDELDDDNKSIEEVIASVQKYLVEGEYRKAVATMLNLQNEFYAVYDVKEEKDSCSSEVLIAILQRIHGQNKKARLVNASPEVQDEVEKHSKAIEYLEGALEFSELIGRALPIILTFLDSNVVTDVLEAVHFFTAAYLFGFEQALEGVRKMLCLVFSKEQNVKSAVSDAYKELYFQTSGSGRQQSMVTVKNLSDLVLKLNYGQLDALEEVVKEWVKAGIIDKNCVQVMFERFSMKLPGTGTDHSWAALVLIRMVGAEESKIIKSNLSLLIDEGLKSRGSKNFLVAKETCKALHHLLPAKEQGKVFDHGLRYPSDHEVFRTLYHVLKLGIWRTNDHYYIPMADEAINLVFAICDRPDEFCKNLIVDLHESISSEQRPIQKKNLVNGNVLNSKNSGDLLLYDANEEEGEGISKAEDATEDPEISKNPDELFISLLTRFVEILGQVASNYILFLEGPILDELKLRNQREYERKLKKFEDNSKFNISLKKNRRAGIHEPAAGGDRSLNETGTEDLEFNRVAADDMDAEEMRKKTENEIVTGNGFLAKFVPLVLAICKKPGMYNNKALQNAALSTLARFMQVSSVLCEENLQLLVTICERSQTPERQENGIIALGALQYRFPNSLEPWTPHMYAMLQNPNPSVRYSSILVLTDLIVNEMIKVRSHISNLAVCIVEKELKIARVARHFFREYSQKGNSLYNVLPSLISNLTQVNSPLNPEEFKVVMKFVLKLVTKEKQSEYLVEKLCQYFESATTPRQWCDLAYCLSLLNYGDKGLKKILENIRSFAGKLYIAEVYEAFCAIASDAGKNPQKDKTLVKELAEIVKEYRDKSCADKSVCAVTKKTNPPPPSAKKKPRRRYLPSDSEDEQLEERTRPSQKQKRRNSSESSDGDVDAEGEGEAFLSDASSKKPPARATRMNGNKENEISDEGDVVDDDSGESVKKQAKRTRSSKAAIIKKLKTEKAFRDSSEEDERSEARKRLLRSGRKRK